ncbi:hypothetical protein BN159_2160 [Streptomyces davaonensis JCM 4913]|uniref:Secreted protein n=1 Tax=Streptomyces davaonensis (strain DSM 101723 / JCM 4913 / KCC S-0913 / 768) TaxID=1214101 RepID=K4R1J8_STRDJ|nr:hypothetical protein [Streptomyces davaonensis]CCK26539.1 hypothetical protein BN159_2160 [Streptomyces davaonensis JCM 4913]
MPKRTRAGAVTVFALAGLTVGAALTVPAGAAAPKAASAPRFLAASELPPHPSSAWTAGRVKDGVPVEMRFCLEEALLAYDSRYRPFRTDLDASARQLTVVVGTSAKAKALASSLNKHVKSCAGRIEAADPEVEAKYKSYGSLSVEEGARVHGLATETSWGATDIRLLSVGRDGRTVTVVDWSQMGDFSDAPVSAFKKTTKTAVNKLY